MSEIATAFKPPKTAYIAPIVPMAITVIHNPCALEIPKDSEILIDASEKNLSISEHNVTVLYNTGNRTSTKNPISHGVGVLISLFELSLSKI